MAAHIKYKFEEKTLCGIVSDKHKNHSRLSEHFCSCGTPFCKKCLSIANKAVEEKKASFGENLRMPQIIEAYED